MVKLFNYGARFRVRHVGERRGWVVNIHFSANCNDRPRLKQDRGFLIWVGTRDMKRWIFFI